MGINSENNNENLKQQEAMANAIDGATAGAQQFANATEAAGKAGKKMTGSLSEITEGIDDFSEGLDKALKSIHLLPGAIEEYTKIANKNMAYAAEDIREGFIKGIFNEKLWAVRAELGRETEELKIAMEQAKKSMEQAELSNDEYEKHTAQLRYEQLSTAYAERKNMKVSQQLNKKLAYDMKTELLKIGKQMFSDLWNYAKKILDEAYAKDKSTIEQNYGTIMSYNSYNHGEYAKLIDRLQEKIDASGLGDVISINTLQENLTKTMQSGLQGALAESNAYYASIAEKAGITFDWYGSEWTTLISQMNRTGKDYEKVMKSVISTTDDLAEIYGDSKGLSEGRANQMMAAASSLGTTYGLSEDAIGNIYKSLAVTSQELTNYGIDTNNFVQDITGALQSGLSNQDLGVIFGTGGATGDQVEQKIKEGRFDELILQYMNNLEDMYKGQNTEMVNALQGALGSSFSTTDYQAFQTYWEQEGSFSTNFEKAMGKSNSSIGDIEGELKDYVTTQESYETRMENYLADIAEVMVQNPILEVISKTLQSGFATIGGILIGWGGKQLLNKVLPLLGKGGGSGSGSLFNLGKSLFSSKGAGAAANAAQPYSGQALANFGGTTAKAGGLSKLGSLFTNGTAFASKGGTLAKVGSKVFSTGGKALGAAGSLISMGLDAYSGYKENGVEGALRGALTGSGKAAESGWDVAKGAGSAALKGAGIGMIFGPWGAAIGAAVGGITSLAVGLHDLNDDQKQLSVNIEKVNKAAKALSPILDSHKKQYAELVSLEETAKKATEGNSDSVSALVQKYPQLIKYVDSSGKLQGDYADTLETLLTRERQKLGQDTLNDFGAQYGNKDNGLYASSVSKSTATFAKNLTAGAAATESRDIINNQKDGQYAGFTFTSKNSAGQDVTFDMSKFNDSSTLRGDPSIYIGANGPYYQENTSGVGYRVNLTKDYMVKALHDKTGMSKDSLSAMSQEALIGFAGKLGMIHKDTKNLDDYIKAYDKWETQYKDTHSKAAQYFKDLSAVAFTPDNLESWYNDFNSWSGLISSWDSENNGSPVDTFNRGFSILNGLYDLAHTKDETLSGMVHQFLVESGYAAGWEDYEKSFKIKPSQLYDKYNSSANFGKTYKPKFATGTEYVPYDNYLALLHRGEQVKTSAEVALEEANKHIASSTTSKAIHDVVLNQTNTIISILTNIYEVLAGNSKVPVVKAGTIKYDLPGI